MTKQNLVGKRIRVEKYADGREREIVELAWVDKPRGLCKTCKRNEKQERSSRCKECSNSHKLQEHNKQRLLNKIEQQTNG